jgi:hypothetical protein
MLTHNGSQVGEFAGIEGATRAAYELVKAKSRPRAGPQPFGRNPSRFGDTFNAPTRLRYRHGHGPD